MTLSKEQILATSIPQEAVDVPEWGGKVNIRGLSASERDDYEQSLVEVGPDGRTRVKKTQHNVRASLVARCLVDEAGKRLFTDADVAALGEKSGAAIDALWDVARRLSGMSLEAEEEALEGFEPAQGTDSSTA